MDIVERLRSVGGIEGTTRWYINPDGPEAADEIERLREALKKIANDEPPYVAEYGYNRIKDIARAALKGDEK